MKHPITTLAALVLALASAACSEPDGPCAECPPAADPAVSVDLSGAAVPWRRPPVLLELEASLVDGELHWTAAEELGHDAVEVIVAVDGELLVAARPTSSPYQPEPGVTLIGIRPVRGERVGPLHRLDSTESSTAALSPPLENSTAFLSSPPGNSEHADSLTVRRLSHFESSTHALSPPPESHEPLDPLTLRRLSHSCRHAPISAPAPALLATKQSTSWRLDSVDTHLIPSALGLAAAAELLVQAPGDSAELILVLTAESFADLQTTPPHQSAALEGESLTITFDPAPAAGTQVAVAFSFSITDFEEIGIHPADAALTLDSESQAPRLFFFTGRAPLIPAPPGAQALDMPLTLTLELPATWTTASNLLRGDEGRWLGWGPSRGRPTLAAGAYQTATTSTQDGRSVRALALPDEEGNLADLADYAASHAATLDFYRRWGELTQTEVSVAAVSAEHGGSAVYGLVLVPDFIFQRDRSRARDFFLTHELSHQLWGSVVWPASNLDLWLTEGLADYSALRALEALRGADDAELVWEENLELLIRLMAEGYGGNPGRDVPVRPDAAGELQDYVYYLKGSWVLRRLEAIIGREALDRALALYYQGAVHAAASTEDFVAAVHQESGRDLGWFWTQWLHGRGLPELVYAPYFHPEDPNDFEIVVTQVGDAPYPGLAWRLLLRLDVGDRSGWVCTTARQHGFRREHLAAAHSPDICRP